MARKSRRSKSTHARKRRGIFFRTVRSLFLLGVLLAFGVVLLYGMWAAVYPLDRLGEMPQRSIVYDMDGRVLSRLHGENRIVVPIDDVSEHFVEALLAREDARFYSHRGIDPIGIARAIVRNVMAGTVRQGASTITQQLARNTYPLGGRNLHRKALEAMLSLRLEAKLSKDEILEHYMNRIYFGSGLYGIETASQAYFGKPSRDLSKSEGALLAGIIRSPGRFSPFNNLEGAILERNTVLDRLVTIKKLDREEAESIKRWPVNVAERPTRSSQENYAMDAIMRDLELILQNEQTEDGGLHIYTTIDPAIMKSAEEALDGHLTKVESASGFPHPRRAAFTDEQRATEEAPRYVQGAVVVMDNRTGAIRALVGGRDYRESKYNRAIHAMRQVGSTFKPFVYAAAYQRGLLPVTLVSDARIAPGEIRSISTNWSPSNADDNYGGFEPAATGLIRSRNTMSVRVGEAAGLDEVIGLAGAAGLGTGIPRTPAVYLGAFETTLKDLTAAYSIFANEGERRQSFLIERIDDPSGQTIYKAAHIRAQTMDPGVAFITTQNLRDVMERGTGASAKSQGVTFPAAGKTGTTNDYTDAWFVGYTTTLTCGVWVGMDRPGQIMNRGFGGTLALPIWAKVIAAATGDQYPAREFEYSGPMQQAIVCAVSSQNATTSCQSHRTAVTVTMPESAIPRTHCSIHTGQVATEAFQERQQRQSEPNFFQRLFRRR